MILEKEIYINGFCLYTKFIKSVDAITADELGASLGFFVYLHTSEGNDHYVSMVR
jgi:hypothetical protein